MRVIRAFGSGMRTMRVRLARGDSLHHRYQKRRWFLEAAVAYADAVTALANGLGAATLHSAGLIGLRDHVASYRKSDRSPRCWRMRPRSPSVGRRPLQPAHQGQPDQGHAATPGRADYGAEVEQTFAKFAQGAVDEHEFTFRQEADMDHVEGAVLDMVAQLHPEVFGCARCVRRAPRRAHRPGHRHLRPRGPVLPRLHRVRRAHPRRRAASSATRASRTSRRRSSRATRSIWRWPASCATSPSPIVPNDLQLKGARTHPRGDRPEPGRQDDVRPDGRPAPLPGPAGPAGAGPRSPALPVRSTVRALRASGGCRVSHRQARGRPAANPPHSRGCDRPQPGHPQRELQRHDRGRRPASRSGRCSSS